MRSIYLREFGGPEVLKVDSNIPTPTITDDQILIKVTSAGVNPVDTYIRNGGFPGFEKVNFTVGLDGAGVVEQVGKNVTRFKKGDRAYTACNYLGSGTYAEYVAADTIRAGKLGDKLKFQEGAGIGVPYYTAYKSLKILVNGKGGETVLVHGASGAVGIASVQIAKSLGLTVVGTAGTAEGLKLVKDNGADYVFNHREKGYMENIKSTVPGGIDIILEMLSNVNLPQDLDLIKFRGRVCIIGSRGEVSIDPISIMLKEITVVGVILFHTTDEEWKEMHGYLEAGIRQGWLKPHIGLQFPLKDASKAHDTVINTSGAMGRIVLNI